MFINPPSSVGSDERKRKREEIREDEWYSVARKRDILTAKGISVFLFGSVCAMSGLIQQILITEKKADDILRNAERENAKIVAKAHEKALEALTEKKKIVERQVNGEIKQRMERIEQQKKRIHDKYAVQVEELERATTKEIGKGVSFVLRTLLSEGGR